MNIVGVHVVLAICAVIVSGLLILSYGAEIKRLRKSALVFRFHVYNVDIGALAGFVTHRTYTFDDALTATRRLYIVGRVPR